jgi:hypothetical protein
MCLLLDHAVQWHCPVPVPVPGGLHSAPTYQGWEYRLAIAPALTQRYAYAAEPFCTGRRTWQAANRDVDQKKVVAIAVRRVPGRRHWSKLQMWCVPPDVTVCSHFKIRLPIE